MAELYLIRHAQTDWNAERRLQGSTDRPLSALGRDQACQLRSVLGQMAFDAVFCSDLKRTRETGNLAGLIAMTSTPLWREFDVGRWSGMLIDDVKSMEPHAYAAWRAGLANPPGGESWAAFDGRVQAALSSVAGRGWRRVAVVTHNGVIRAAMRILKGATHDPLRSFDNASVTKVLLAEGGQVTGLFTSAGGTARCG